MIFEINVCQRVLKFASFTLILSYPTPTHPTHTHIPEGVDSGSGPAGWGAEMPPVDLLGPHGDRSGEDSADDASQASVHATV